MKLDRETPRYLVAALVHKHVLIPERPTWRLDEIEAEVAADIAECQAEDKIEMSRTPHGVRLQRKEG